MSLPLVGGSTKISDIEKGLSDSNLLNVSTSDAPEPNEKGMSGFLIPHPMGSAYDMHTDHFGAGKPMTTGDKLEHQVVNLYSAVPADAGGQTLTISDMPGGVPFPDIFTFNPVKIPNDTVHIGGMTDVYVKSGSITERSSAEIKIQPEAPIQSFEEGGQIVFEGSDGIINCSINQSHFDSPTLIAELSSLYGSAPRPLDNLVVEILDPPTTEIQPVFFRAVHTTDTGVKIDGEFPASLGLGFEQLRFRVLKECATNLVEPLIILKQGTDLVVKKNEMTAWSPSGYNFADNPENITIYLHIDSDIAYGEYEVTGINLNNLVLDKAFSESGSGLSYRIYKKQGAGLAMPIVRVKEVSLSGDSEGVNVPYRHPVDVQSSDFAGLNDDPINEDTLGISGGYLTLEEVDLDSDGAMDTEPELEVTTLKRMCFTVDASINLSDYGTAIYDVLKLEDMDAPNKYWYVEGLTNEHWPVDRWLDFAEEAVPNVPAGGLKVTVNPNGYLRTVDGAVPTPIDLRAHLKNGDKIFEDTHGGLGTVKELVYDPNTGNSDIYFSGDFQPNIELTLLFKRKGTNNKLILDREQALPASVGGLRFTLGHPSIGTGRVFFKEPTFFEAGPDTVFTYKDQETNKEWYLRPSPAESATIYKSPQTQTDVKLNKADPENGTRKLTSREVDFFKHNIKPGDKLRISSDVLWSRAFMSGLEEDKNLMVAGKTLAMSIDGSVRTCTFSGPNPMTLDDVVADINRQLGDAVLADVFQYNASDKVGPGVAEEEVNGPGYRIRLFSAKDINLLTQGTIGILSSLGFDDPSERDNTPDPQLIREYTVSRLLYSPAVADVPAEYSILLTQDSTQDSLQNYALGSLASNKDLLDDGIWDRYYDLLFIEVYREKYQRVYPADLTLGDDGLYYTDIRLTSYDANTSTGIVPDESALTPTNYDSLGYEIVVSNTNYSYSVGEDSSIRVTSVALSKTATSFETVYEVAAANVTLSYEQSDLVQSAQTFMLQPFTRVVCNNPLVRHYLPAYPIASISHTGPRSNALVKDDLATFFSSLYPNKPLEVSDLLGVLQSGGSTYIKLPQEAAFLVHDESRRLKVVRGKDVIVLGTQYHIMEDISMVKVNGE